MVMGIWGCKPSPQEVHQSEEEVNKALQELGLIDSIKNYNGGSVGDRKEIKELDTTHLLSQ